MDHLTETELFALRQLEQRKAELLRSVQTRMAPDYRAFSALVEARLGLAPGWSVSAVTGEIEIPATTRAEIPASAAPARTRRVRAQGND